MADTLGERVARKQRQHQKQGKYEESGHEHRFRVSEYHMPPPSIASDGGFLQAQQRFEELFRDRVRTESS
jgi:hypothetical protein